MQCKTRIIELNGILQYAPTLTILLGKFLLKTKVCIQQATDFPLLYSGNECMSQWSVMNGEDNRKLPLSGYFFV